MLYDVDGKICIATGSYYKEVSISKNGDDFTVKVKDGAEKIERKRSNEYNKVTIEEAYKKRKLLDENRKNKL